MLLGEELKLDVGRDLVVRPAEILQHVLGEPAREMVIRPTHLLGPTDPISSPGRTTRRSRRWRRTSARTRVASWRSATFRRRRSRVIEGDELGAGRWCCAPVVADGIEGYQAMPGARLSPGGGSNT